jgi:hypothetical protein
MFLLIFSFSSYGRDVVTCPLQTATISEFEPTFDTFPILSVRSEEISQTWVVWGKAVALSRYHVSPTTDCLGKHLPSDEGRKFTFDLDFEAFLGTVGTKRDAVDQSAKTGDE